MLHVRAAAAGSVGAVSCLGKNISYHMHAMKI